MLELQCRQHPDHHHLGVVRVDSRVCDVEGRPQFLLQFESRITGEWAGLDVHLDVELSRARVWKTAESSMDSSTSRLDIAGLMSPVTRFELDLHAQQRSGLVDGVSEVTTVEHLLHGVDARAHLLTKEPTVGSGEFSRRDLCTHCAFPLRRSTSLKAIRPVSPTNENCGGTGKNFPTPPQFSESFFYELSTPGDSYAASLQPRCGIDLCAVLGNLEVQVRAGGLATVTHGGDLLAGVDALADVDLVVVDVAVRGDRAVVVLDADPEAET